MARTLLIGGSIAQKPFYGGHTWVFLQYLLGFRDLGWEVLFLDRLEPDMCFDELGRPCPAESSVNLRYVEDVMRAFGLDGSYAVFVGDGACAVGLSRSEVLARARKSVLLLNVNGFVDDEDLLAAAPKRVFLDIDPGFPQMWRELGLHDALTGYDAYVTVGENIGRPDCEIPTCGLEWIVTAQPVFLEQWPRSTAASQGRPFTSVGIWRGGWGTIEFRGQTYGPRPHEFRKFFRLPTLVSARFELAFEIDPAEKNDLDQLHENGWSLVDPKQKARDPWRYRDYIGGSRAEFGVSQSRVVKMRSGWFSDRSICYLASGRPVLVQDTGWTENYPAGEGLLAYSTLEEAVAGVEQIEAEYERHCSAARDIAEVHFDSRKVLTRLLANLNAN